MPRLLSFLPAGAVLNPAESARHPWWLLLVLVLSAVPAAVRGQSVPDGGEKLVNVADLAINGTFWGGTSTDGQPIATRTIVPVTGQPFSQAARIDLQRPNGVFYSTGIVNPSSRAVAQGDVVLLHFFLRTIETSDESGSVFLEAYAEGPDFTKSLSYQASAGLEWTEYFLPFEVVQDYPAGQLTIAFGLGSGARPSVFEIGGAEVWWYEKTRTLAEMPRTAFSYEGRAADAPWRAQAAARIEQYRKADYTVRVVDPAGARIDGARVRVRLRRHAFPFGTAVVSSRIMDPSQPDNATYRSRLVQVFNAASPENDLKWGPWDGEWGGSFNREQTQAALRWLQERDFHLRGHVLVWPSERNLPDSIDPLLRARDPSVPDRIRAHITEIVTATRDVLVEWDVLNEPYDNHDVMDAYGEEEMVTWFQTARVAHPTAKLYINDYSIVSGGGLNVEHQDHYEDTIAYLIANGAPIDGLGMQGHFGASPTGITKAWSVFERYAQAFPNLKIKITEFDIDTDDEQLQADYTRDFLTLAFSHPAVAGFQVWGFWAGAHWRDRAAMYRLDWTEKPNGAAFRQLVHEVWQTDDTRTTATNGQVSGRGFHGTYDVTVTVGGRSVTHSLELPAAGGQWTVTFDPDARSSRLANLSTRGTVGTGADVMIAGFVITGSGTKDVLVRGIGPKLADFGVSGVLADPRLRLFQGNEQVPFEQNDDWEPALAPVFSQAGAFGLDGDARSAALRLRLPAGRYTAQLSDEAEGSGVGIVEVYDLDTGTTIAPTNLSTRGRVNAGDGIMIGGFVVHGTAPKRLLIRGVGPALAAFDVPGYLADAAMVLYRQDAQQQWAEVARNDNWEAADNVAEIAAVSGPAGAFALPAGSRDAVLLLDLEPGNYSVHLSGVGNATGVGLIEVYSTPE